MTASVLPNMDLFSTATREVTLDDLPSEAVAVQARQGTVKLEAEPSLSLGPSARVLWRDAVSRVEPPQSVPPTAIPRLKRSLMDSPFAGSVSKRPFRSRTFEHSQADEPVTIVKEEPPCPPVVEEDAMSTENLRGRLPSIPAVVTTSSYLQVSIHPVIWRAQEAPGGLVMHVGLTSVQLEGQHDLQLYLWSTMNPRIVTTGIPAKTESTELGDSSTAEPEEVLEVESGSASRTRHGRAYTGPVAAPPSKKERCNLLLEEVFLVRKDPQRRIPDEVFHTTGPFEGGTVMCMPDWPGDIWSFDICCRVSDGSSEPIFVKSLDRRLQ